MIVVGGEGLSSYADVVTCYDISEPEDHPAKTPKAALLTSGVGGDINPPGQGALKRVEEPVEAVQAILNQLIPTSMSLAVVGFAEKIFQIKGNPFPSGQCGQAAARTIYCVIMRTRDHRNQD